MSATPPLDRPGNPATSRPALSFISWLGVVAGFTSLKPPISQAAESRPSLIMTDHGLVRVDQSDNLSTLLHVINNHGLVPLFLVFFLPPVFLGIVLWLRLRDRQDGGKETILRLWLISILALIPSIYAPRIFDFDPLSSLGMAVATTTVLIAWGCATGLFLEGLLQFRDGAAHLRPFASRVIGSFFFAGSAVLLSLICVKFSELPDAIIHAPGISPLVLVFALLTLRGNTYEPGEGLIQRILGQSLMNKVEAAGGVNLFKAYQDYFRKWHFRRSCLTFPLAIVLPPMLHGDTITSIFVVCGCLFIGQAIDMQVKRYWMNYKSIASDTRFRFPTAHPTPAGEHGTAGIQGSSDLAASGFVDEV